MRRVDWKNVRKNRRSGFTLLELLVVVAIMAIVGSGIIAAYDGIEEKAGEGQAVHGIGALDSALRSKKVLDGQFPDDWDSLMETTGNGTSADLYRNNNAENFEHLGLHTLAPEGVAALNAVGIDFIRYVDGDLIDSDGVEFPGRVFDDPAAAGGRAILGDGDPDNDGLRGEVSIAGTSGLQVAAARTGDGTNPVITAFDGTTDPTSQYINEVTGLPLNQAHLVVALGIGNNNTLINKSGGGVSLSEAPAYQNVLPLEYNRFIAFFHLASDQDGNGAFDPADYLEEAQLLAVVESKTEPLVDELAEFNEPPEQ